MNTPKLNLPFLTFDLLIFLTVTAAVTATGKYKLDFLRLPLGGGPRVVVSTAAFHARVRGSVPGLGGFEKNKNVSSTCESQYCGEPP